MMIPEWCYWVAAIAVFLGVSFFGWYHPSDWRLHKQRKEQLRKWLGLSLVLFAGCSSGQAPRTVGEAEELPTEFLHPPPADSVGSVGSQPHSPEASPTRAVVDAMAPNTEDAGAPVSRDLDSGSVMTDSGVDAGAPLVESGSADSGPAPFPACLAKPLGGCCKRGGALLECEPGGFCQCSVDGAWLFQGEFDYWCPGLLTTVEGECDVSREPF